ncbi:MAG: O-antigen ligase family protein [Bacteroidia bacterium]|nr:O-antigen ligase family protein [Bacteroidia bacterium]
MPDTVLHKTHIRWFYGLSLSFLACSLFFITREMYWLAAFPVFVAITYLAIFSIDTLLFIIAGATPLAVLINRESSGPALSLPTEPLLFGVMVIFILKVVFEGGFDKRIIRHPVSLVIFFQLIWMFITSITSTMPLVSFKHLLSQMWFILPFYFLATQLFRKFRNIEKFIWIYSISLLIVITYTIIRHAQNAWTQKSAHWVMAPFYNDHTAYAAAIALFIPVFILLSRDNTSGFRQRMLSLITFICLSIAMILSYTRASWLSLVIAFVVYLIYRLRIRFSIVAILGGSMLTIFLMFQSDIFIKLERNRQDSATDFNKHLQSISNISTDASNLERINRWHSAIRMWEEKPFLGWGPGTYQFNYAPFQKASEMTIISTNAGNMGNAHSEYLGPLSEQGVFGMLAVVLLIITVFYRVTVMYSHSKDRKLRTMALGITLGLVTYFIHGIMNNFLDTDKLSIPVWAFIAAIVAMDVYHSRPVLPSHNGNLQNKGILN